MLSLSDRAISEMLRLQSKQPSPQTYVRLRVEASGCQGLSYGLSFDTQFYPTDQHVSYPGITILVDAQSAPLLTGLVMDYSEDLMGGAFQFKNPHAVKTCDCGISFAVSPALTEETLPAWGMDSDL
jgi:iron-sulfur cluster assembly accessory protein